MAKPAPAAVSSSILFPMKPVPAKFHATPLLVGPPLLRPEPILRLGEEVHRAWMPALSGSRIVPASGLSTASPQKGSRVEELSVGENLQLPRTAMPVGSSEG